MRRELPFPLLHLHTDNGGEFLNRVLYPWMKAQNIQMSRGRPYRKNDQAYAEQRNFYIVRRFIGYGRYSTREAHHKLTELCRLVVLYNNFFQPISKVVDTQRQGAKVKRTYDIAQTPYQRLVTSGVLDEQKRRSLEQIEDARRALWYLSDPDGANRDATSSSGDA
jgi:transposase InsO family protein